MLYCLKFTVIFLLRLIWNIIRSPYLSVVTAISYTKRNCQRKLVSSSKRGGFDKPPVFLDQHGKAFEPKKRHRRGHRGGKKHRKQHNHGGNTHER